MLRTALIIPVFNEGGRFRELYRQIIEYIDIKDIIIVDDGSDDNCCEFLKGEKSKVFRHEANLGKGTSLQTGFRIAIQSGFSHAMSIDADGQHEPSIIPAFIDAVDENQYDLVIGKRDRKLSDMPWDRIFSNTLTSAFLSLISGQRIYDAQCGFRMYNLEFIKKIKLNTSGYDTENEILLKAFHLNAKIGWVNIPTIYNDEESHINRASDTWRFIVLVLKYLTRRLN
jgi:glycosyltransferase involved in cell wall biosynthesis